MTPRIRSRPKTGEKQFLNHSGSGGKDEGRGTSEEGKPGMARRNSDQARRLRGAAATAAREPWTILASSFTSVLRSGSLSGPKKAAIC